jgi:hypothetical protein
MGKPKIIAIPEEREGSCVGCVINPNNSYCSPCSEKCDEFKILNGFLNGYSCSNNKTIFKEEKDMNTMPELKAGMIFKGQYSKTNLFLYINDHWSMCLTNNEWTSLNPNTKDYVVEIYECKSGIKTYEECTNNLELIWSRKSDKDIKIEEIQKKMDALSKEMEELKG